VFGGASSSTALGRVVSKSISSTHVGHDYPDHAVDSNAGYRVISPVQTGYAVYMTVSNSLACCATGRRWTTVSHVTSAAGPFTGQSLE
jgi:hypothetical protein